MNAAPSFTRNKDWKPDPEIHQTKKGNQWYFGMKVHTGMDKDSGLIHSVVVTAAIVQAVTSAADLFHGHEEVAYGDAAYQGIAKMSEMAGRKAEFRVAMRPGQQRALPDTPEGKLQDLIETLKAHLRAMVEYPIRVIKQQFDLQKARLRGFAQSHCKIHVLVALTNLFFARRWLLLSA